MAQQAQNNTKGGQSPARKAAVQALVKLHGGMYANLAAKGVPAALSQQDKAFAGALFYGTAERIITLDVLLDTLSKKPMQKLDAEVRAVLEAGLYQLLYMRVPPSAAVNESVKLTRALGKTSAAGLVNAVLRRAAAIVGGVREGSGDDIPATQAVIKAFGLQPQGEAQRVSLEYAVSPAVAEAVMQALPQEYEAFFSATQNVPPRLTLRVNTLQTTQPSLKEQLEAEGARVETAPLENALYARLPDAVAADPLFKQGRYHVQGLASQYAAACVGAAPGMKVLDLCAAPGGKSATLAQYMGGGKGLCACDVHPHRVKLVEETLHRLGIGGAKVLQNDAAIYNEALARQDRILCDVPCSGLGVLAKKPDMRLNDGAGWVELPRLQAKILDNAARYLAPGGRIVYATCTIRPEENGEVVRQFLQTHEGFAVAPPPVQPLLGAQNTELGTTFLPHKTGTDGFFVASLERIW